MFIWVFMCVVVLFVVFDFVCCVFVFGCRLDLFVLAFAFLFLGFSLLGC